MLAFYPNNYMPLVNKKICTDMMQIFTIIP